MDMKGTVAFWCFSLLLCCSGGSSREEGGPASRGSFLWQIDDGSQGPPSYFFGTIHVPYTRVWDAIPNNTKAAFEAASQVVHTDKVNNNTNANDRRMIKTKIKNLVQIIHYVV